MRVDVVTLFPELFEPFLAVGMVGRGVSAGALRVRLKSPREFGLGRHRSVDDTPYGGGSGMVMRVDCIVDCLEALDADSLAEGEGPPPRGHRVLLCPQGAPFHQRKARELVERGAITLICGRYEGFDERVRGFVDEEVSLGDFVLSGGEVAAMAIIDACSRLVPGVLGNAASAERESHSEALGGLLEYPQYTRPVEYRGARVPEVLQGGNHAQIEAWRLAEADRRTRERRPESLGRGRARPRGRACRRAAEAHARAPRRCRLSRRRWPPSRQRRDYVMNRIALALVHHPVLDRGGDVVTTAITNLDLHDMARSARTYGIGELFVVHPIEAQRLLAIRIQEHWVEGSGKRRIPDRAAAMDVLRVVPALEDAYAALGGRESIEIWTTAAATRGRVVTRYPEARGRLEASTRPVLILFGTGWGLSEDLVTSADVRLEPIRAHRDTGYNHLSVRAACAITLDRLLG
ncbi:MAG: tRNA (guanosine(37)-N1)-methyltransferase TrmD [Minicystis sp.]